ncbi:hypothetical protein [Endozoicomonas atrinae]|uniref:hypothetical protein n=1 Tax=Endozoicomonas atrinae TaxID=1333660 RepID=UPI000AD94A59|nr:hypothetical protein [Endozoicomonas atrinae]
MKWITILIMVIGLVLIVYSGSMYIQSGEVAQTIPLDKIGESEGSVELTPDMSPVRVILNTEFISRTKSEAVRFYSYTVDIRDDQNNEVLSQSGALTLRRESKDIPANELSRTQRRIHSIDVFSVPKKSTYHWEAQLTNRQAEVSSAHLEIRRNVETELPMSLWLGLGLLIGGILLGFFITKRSEE